MDLKVFKHRLCLLFVLTMSSLLPAQTPACPQSSHIAISSGIFSSQEGVTFRLRNFVATLVPRGNTAPSCLEKMTVMTHGEIFVSNESLSRIFAVKLEATDSKIKNFKVENGLGKVRLTGKITKLIPIEFSIEGPVTTDGTSLQLEARTIKADGIPIKALLEAVGEHLNSVLSMKGVNGVSIKDNVLSFSPEQIAHLRGHIDSAETRPDGLILRYTRAATPGKKLVSAQ